LKFAEIALDKFNHALSVEGRGQDPMALELKFLQLVKLNRFDDADEQIAQFQKAIVSRLAEVPPTDVDNRQKLLVQLARSYKVEAEIDHKQNANGRANDHLLKAIRDQYLIDQFFAKQLRNYELLLRAEFHELHGCVTAQVHGLPQQGQARDRLRKAADDYKALYQQCLEGNTLGFRILCWFGRRDNGRAHLLLAAVNGLKRTTAIEASVVPGTPYCLHHNPDAIRTSTPAQ
jgi:hypothetical protein